MEIKGICTLSAIALRKLPNSASEMVSQLLFGDIFIVNNSVSDVNGWINITTQFDNYTGFISENQFAGYNNNIESWQTNTLYPFTKLVHGENTILVPAGASIPNASNFILGNEEYSITTQNANCFTANVEEIAKQYVGVPYLWGGKTPFGIDCSGLSQQVFKQCGITLPRDAYQQAKLGSTVSFLAETKVGDLAFFDNEDGNITHVGIMLNNNKIIHASGKVRIDELDHHGILNNTEKQYSHKLRIIKRIF